MYIYIYIHKWLLRWIHCLKLCKKILKSGRMVSANLLNGRQVAGWRTRGQKMMGCGGGLTRNDGKKMMGWWQNDAKMMGKNSWFFVVSQILGLVKFKKWICLARSIMNSEQKLKSSPSFPNGWIWHQQSWNLEYSVGIIPSKEHVPSGKLTHNCHNYRKSSFRMGKSTIISHFQ